MCPLPCTGRERARRFRRGLITKRNEGPSTSDERIADLARRRLVVVERQGQAHIIRFCVKVTSWVKPDPECVPPLTSAAWSGP